MYWDVELTPEEEEKILRKIAETIHKYRMDVVAILTIETMKPMTYFGAQMGRFLLSPYLPALGENAGISGEKLFQILEKHDNSEKLIQMIEELVEEDERQKREAKKAKELEKGADAEAGETPKKKGWRRFLPF